MRRDSAARTRTRRKLADRVVVVKSAHTLTLYSRGQILKSYKVSLGRGEAGPKDHQGDHKTPEGAYVLDMKNAKSRFHLALHVSYPTPQTASAPKKKAWTLGEPSWSTACRAASVGSALFSITSMDDGCIAVTIMRSKKIWRLVPVDTPIEINREPGFAGLALFFFLRVPRRTLNQIGVPSNPNASRILVLEESLEAEVQLDISIREQHKRRRSYCRLRHIEDAQPLGHGTGARWKSTFSRNRFICPVVTRLRRSIATFFVSFITRPRPSSPTQTEITGA